MTRILPALLALGALVAWAALPSAQMNQAASMPNLVYRAPGMLGDGTINPAQGKFQDGSSVAPSITFGTETTLGLYRFSAGVIGFTGNFLTSGSGSILTGSGGALGFVSRTLGSSPVDGQLNLTNNAVTAGVGLDIATDGVFKLRTRAQNADALLWASGFSRGGVVTISATAPTISSGFGTSPSIASSNGTAAFTINVGTGGVATSGVIGLPAATTGWRVTCDDVTTQSATVFLTKQTARTTTTATVGLFNTAGAAAAWAASDILVCSAMAY